MTEFDKNLTYAARLHAEDPQGFKDLLTQLKAFEPNLIDFMAAAAKFPAPAPLDVQTYEELEELSIELDNISARVRELMKGRRGDLTAGLILENLKAASRHIQDAADNMLEMVG